MEVFFFNYETKYKDHDDKLLIMIYGVTKEGKDIYLRVEDFLFPLKVQLNEDMKWDKIKINALLKDFKAIKCLKELGRTPIKGEILWERVYYGAAEAMENPEKPFLRLYFWSLEGAKHFTNYIKKWWIEKGNKNIVDIFEYTPAQIDPVKKMFAITGANYCQWHKALCYIPKEKTSNFDLEYTTSYKSIEPIPQDMTIDWKINWRILSFDLEVYSSKKNRMPRPMLHDDVIYLSTMSFKTIGDKDWKKYAIGTMELKEEPRDYVYIKVKKELQIIEKMAELIQKHQPHIVTGHNINGFDYRYMDNRLKRKNRDEDTRWPQMGRVFHETTKIGRPVRWKSSGAGEINLYILDMSGRITIDTLNYVQRNTKIRKKNLKTIGEKFVGVHKIDLPAREQFKIYRAWIDALENNKITDEILTKNREIVDYGVRDSEIPALLFDNEKMNILLNQLVMSNVARTPVCEVLTGGEMRKCRSLLYNLSINDPDHTYVFTPRKKTEKTEKYDGALVQEPKVGYWDPVIWQDFSSMYPTIIIAYNICHTTWIPPGVEFPDDKVNKIDITDKDGNILRTHRFLKKEIRQGLLPRMVDGLIKARAKYKELMKPYEIADGKYKAPPGEEQKLAMLDTYQNKLKIIANSGYGYTGSTETNDFSFIEGAESITAVGRREITKVADHAKSKHNGIIVYGDTDSVALWFEDVSAQNCHQFGKQLAEEINQLMMKPMKISYEKSTRSVFIKKKFYISVFINKEGNYLLGADDILYKGVLKARGDSCPWVQNVYAACSDLIIRNNNLRTVLQTLVTHCKKLLAGEVPIKDLTLSAKVSESANDDFFIKRIANREKDEGEDIEDLIEFVINKDPVVEIPQEMGKNGKLKKPKKAGVAEKAVLTHKFDPKCHTIDAMYYIENKLSESLDSLIFSAFKSEINMISDPEYIPNRDQRRRISDLKNRAKTPDEKKAIKIPAEIKGVELLNQAGYKPHSRKKFVTIDRPTEIICRMIEDGVDISNLLKIIDLNFKGKTKKKTQILE